MIDGSKSQIQVGQMEVHNMKGQEEVAETILDFYQAQEEKLKEEYQQSLALINGNRLYDLGKLEKLLAQAKMRFESKSKIAPVSGLYRQDSKSMSCYDSELEKFGFIKYQRHEPASLYSDGDDWYTYELTEKGKKLKRLMGGKR